MLISTLANVSQSPFASCSHRFEIHSTEGRKREKSSKFLAGLKNKKDKRHIESESIERHLKVLDTIRVQMQVSYSVPLVFLILFFRFEKMCFGVLLMSDAVIIVQVTVPLLCWQHCFSSFSYNLLVWNSAVFTVDLVEQSYAQIRFREKTQVWISFWFWLCKIINIYMNIFVWVLFKQPHVRNTLNKYTLSLTNKLRNHFCLHPLHLTMATKSR